MSLVQSSMEHLPLIAPAAAYAAGFGADLIAQKQMEQSNVAVTESLHELGTHQPQGMVRRLGRAAISTSALIGIPVGLTIGLAWQGETPVKRQLPIVEVVIDASGATASADNGKPAQDIYNYAYAIDGESKVKTEAYISSGGSFQQGTIDMLTIDTPQGGGDLPAAATSALNGSNTVKAEALNGESNQAVGIVVLTNGNTIGDPNDIINKAQPTKTPVYVVNVETKVRDQAKNEALKVIAEQTGGQYWTVADTNPEEVAGKVADNLKQVTTREKHAKQPNWPLRLVSLATLALIPLAARRRRREPVMLTDFK